MVQAPAAEPKPQNVAFPLPKKASPGPAVVTGPLRKPQNAPLPLPKNASPAPVAQLPVQRRSAEELDQIRRKEAFALQMNLAEPLPNKAHPGLVISGYLLIGAAALGGFYYDLAILITASCVGAGLVIAGVIQFTKPLSRHHAAFISVMALLVIVFGALYYFPHLRHGS